MGIRSKRELIKHIKRLQESVDLLRQDLNGSTEKEVNNMANVYNYSFEISGLYNNPCNGENVAIEGKVHYVLNQTVDENGGYHFNYHGNLQNVQGEGLTTGAKYRLTEAFNESYNVRPDGFPFEATLVDNFKVVGQGNVPNFNAKLISTFIVNANDEIVVDNYRIETNCR